MISPILYYLDSVCIRVSQRSRSNKSDKKEIYFEKLAHEIVGRDKPEIHGAGLQAGNSGRIDNVYSWGRISFSPEASGFALMAFNCLSTVWRVLSFN